ncbi:MAG TPA: DUF6285 domain-containing protein [Rhizomicrobium sp.]|jgi:hypothetical protein|nr:DUF6285 domain-containing protein [Rhizomicrobium sp.]
MMDQPSMHELVVAVRDFLEQRAMPELKGHTAFHARVAANALGIVARELELGAASGDAERARLAALLGRDGALPQLNRELCAQIRSGRIGLETPGLAEHLTATTRDKVGIDQPNYGGLKRLVADGA